MANLLSTILSGNNHITFGPNSTWSSYLRVGGNGHSVSSNEYASVVTTNGNLHLDAGTSRATYINYYAGTAGVAFGNGASGISAWMGADGDLWKGGSDNSGTQYIYNSGTWGISITGNASKLDPLSGDGNYKLAYTADGARNNAGEWGRAVMYYVPNGQTYGIRVDRADYSDNSGALSGLGVGSFLRDDGWNTYPGQDANTQGEMRVDFTYSNNAPYTGELIRFGSSGYSTQFNTSYGNSDNFAFRTRNGDNATWNAWRNVIHSGNIGSQSVNYATSAGNSDTLDSLDSSEFARGRASYQVLNLDTIKQPGLYQYDGGIGGTQPEGADQANLRTIEIGSGGRYSQMAFDWASEQAWFRRQTGDTWSTWREFIHSGNYSSYVVPKTGGSFTGGIGGTTFDFGEGGYIGGATTIASNLTVNQVYNNGWFRNYGNQGLYNETYGNHWYATSNATWNAAGNNGSYVEIAMRTGGHQGPIRGYFYADSSANIGILNNAGNWSLLTNSSRNTTLYGQLTVGEGIGYSSIFMTDSDEGTRELHCNSNRIGFLTQAGSWGAWLYDSADWEAGSSVRAPIFYDSNDTTFFLDPNADLSLRVYGEICNSNYAEGKMQPGALNIGRIDTNYAWDGGSWASDVRLGLLANTSETWEFGIHDSGDSVMSVVHFDGGSTLTMGRNLGWGQCVVNAPAGYVSNGNAWGTANSAFFPNGITTAGGTNWIYGTTTYIGNAPSNGSGHDFSSSGHQLSTGSITVPLFLVNNHSDNTRGYRIHNTSGSSVSAMFTNSANALVIGAGAFDQVQLNKKVLVSGAALGVNVAASATAGRIDASNDIVAYSSSDERLKYNIAPIENALDKVKSLTGVEFDWKPEYKHAHGYEGHDTGIIAQQVQDVMPSAVRTNETGFLAVRYEKLIGLLIEANKELAARVEELEKKLG